MTRPRAGRWPALSALLLALPVACGDGGDEAEIPPGLLGTWRTEAPAYADRALEIADDVLIFHLGDGTFTVHPIRDIGRSVDPAFPDAVVLTFRYAEEGGRVYSFPLLWDPAAGTLRFRNRAGIRWTRAPPGR